MTRYKHAGLFQRMRTERRWIVAIDNEEFTFVQKRNALLSATASRAKGFDTKLFEETILYFSSPAGLERSRDSFRIDITNQLDYQDVSERP